MNYLTMAQKLRESESVELGTGASDDELRRAEQALGVAIPPDYRRFLLDFGWARIGHWELFGAGRDVPAYLNIQAVTASEREEMRPSLPPTLLPIANDGGGNLLCLDTASVNYGAECPVIGRDHETGSTTQVSASFLAWMDHLIAAL